MRKMQNRKAVSPVIATVILVAVAITVSVAVSYWMGGISSQYTKFEQVEVSTGYSTKTTGSGWLLTLNCKNTGTAASNINNLFINEVLINSTGYGQSAFPPDASGDRIHTNIAVGGTTLDSGEDSVIYIWIYNDGTDGYAKLSSGTTINVKLHSSGGMDYIKLIELV